MMPNRLPQSAVMTKSFIANFTLIVVKIVGGILFTSTALIADGVHSISDLLTDIFVILGITHSAKPADEEHPLGHGKFEYVLSIFLGFSIMFMAYQIIINVATNFNEITTIPKMVSLVVVLFVVLIKLLLSRYVLSEGRRLESEVLIASGKESMTDVISSVVVFVGITATLIGDALSISWLHYGDKVAGIVVALLIVKIAISIIIDNVQSILGKSASKTTLERTRARVLKIDGVLAVDRLNMIVYGHYYQVLIDIRVDGTISVKDGHDIASIVQDTLKKDPKITHVTVHVNPEES